MANRSRSHVRLTDGDRFWQQLLAGNRLFAAGARRHPRQTVARRCELAAGQHPFAIVIGCSDSRVPPELVFGCGLGDLFVIRSAGQVLDVAGDGSIEYAVEHLGVGLVVVLGHTHCGALTAAVNGAKASGRVAPLLAKLQPPVAAALKRPGDALENAIDENVRQEVARLRRLEPLLAGLVASGKLRVVGARYDLRTGLVAPVE